MENKIMGVTIITEAETDELEEMGGILQWQLKKLIYRNYERWEGKKV